jgi:heme oxygenase
LRARTAEEHARVDRLFSCFELGRDDGYRRFLLAQAAAFLPIEEALDRGGAADLLPDWPERKRGDLLRADLEQLQAGEPEGIASPALDTPAAALGAIYVLEGSRLGGAFLKRGLPPEAPQAFLSAPQSSGAWRKLLESLDKLLYRSDQLEAAVGAAIGVFQTFEAGGQLYLESGRR